MLYILILLALLVLSVAIWALMWAIKTRQFDNLEAQAWSVVLDDDRAPPPDDGNPDDIIAKDPLQASEDKEDTS